MSGEKGSFPKSVTIFGREVPIIVVQTLDEDMLGVFYPEEDRIEILATASKSILLHEMVHAALHYSGVSRMLNDRLEEALCVCFEHGLADYFKLQ